MGDAVVVDIDRIGREQGIRTFIALCTPDLALAASRSLDEIDERPQGGKLGVVLEGGRRSESGG